MKTEERKIKTESHPIKSKYTVDCFRAVKGANGDVVVKRWQEDRQVAVTVSTVKGEGVFHRGALTITVLR